MADPITDEAVEAFKRAWHEADAAGLKGSRVERGLEAAAPLIAAKALEVARGPYRCCPHCADDIIHDVEKDDHTVPCDICQNDEINRAVAKALRDAHARLGRAAYSVDSTHHFHDTQCSCGFTGDARKRTQTEHITTAVLEAYNHMTDEIEREQR